MQAAIPPGPIRAIHQFHAGSALGDGVTSAMFFIQAMLRRAGYRSTIYCVTVDPHLTDWIEDVSSHQDDADDILLVHYSLGSESDAWVTSRRARLVLIYHNITPVHFFAPGSAFARLSEAGRRQLAQWAAGAVFSAVIAVSRFNAADLTGLGFPSVAAIPLLVDLHRVRTRPWNAALRQVFGGARNLLFVGRIIDSKNQLGLVRMMHHLRRLHPAPLRLILAGGTSSIEYLAEIHQMIGALGLTDHIRVLGPVSDADLGALYRLADLYVSDSLHEGFGMPLVEAMALGLPVLARAAGGVAATLGPGGVVLNDPSPEAFAAAANILLQERGLRRRVIQGQQDALIPLEQPVLLAAFERTLRQAGLGVTFVPATPPRPAPRSWSIEGPFDSSYSPALVNRELARALSRLGEHVTLTSRDGSSAYAANRDFLALNPDLAAMARPAPPGPPPDIVLRNQYPPFVADLKATVCVLANYAWEESGFPAAWVDEFNTSLDLVTVTSHFVAKVLRDNGVRVPIAVVGNGVDHVGHARPCARTEGRFRFLHVSSGFPRKGVDVLLAAWSRAFTAAEPVELVLKLFPNIHNHVAGDLERFRTAHPQAAPVTLIDADISVEAMMALYATADALVCPSRGEGFGLPLAEAMALGIPVLTTGYGGQTDFCTPETAWLCDYRFADAGTHLAVPDSVWVEPCAGSLSATLRELHAAPLSERARRTEAARALIQSEYTWDAVARRTRTAIDAVLNTGQTEYRKPVIGLVSPWESNCAMAAHARGMMGAIEPDRLRVFAQGLDRITGTGIDAVIIQFDHGLYDPDSLRRVIGRLVAERMPVYLILHSAGDAAQIWAGMRDVFAQARRLLVHTVDDLNRLKAIGLAGNVALFPQGNAETWPKLSARLDNLIRGELLDWPAPTAWTGSPRPR